MWTMSANDWITEFSGQGTQNAYKPGQEIVFQGDAPDQIGYVLSGVAKAVTCNQDGVETWLGAFRKGDFFAHTAFLNQAPATFAISADTAMTALMLPATFIEAQLSQGGDIGRIFAGDLARRLSEMMDRYVEALTMSAKGRVCAELMRLSDPIGVTPDKRIVRPNPIFVDLALRINSTRETVSRTVSALQKDGIVSREAGAMLIERPAALKAAMR